MFRLPTDVFSRPSTLGRRSAFWVLFVIGLTLTATLLLDVYADWIHQGDPLWSTVLENSVPIFLALTLPYIGWGLLQNSPGPFYLPEAAKYALVGGAGLALFSGLVVGAQLLQEQIKPAVIVLQLTTIGALAGLYTGYNVAQLRETKQEAQEDRDRLANLLEGLPAPVVHGTFDGDELTVLKANAAFEEVFGVSVEKVVGKNLYDFVVPEEKQEEAADIDRQAIDQGFVDREVQRRTTEGLRDFQLRVAQALDDGASETYAIYTDITEQKERERDLRLFKKAVEQANDAVLVTEAHPIDEPGPKIEYVNPALEEMTGTPGRNLRGTRLGCFRAQRPTVKLSTAFERPLRVGSLGRERPSTTARTGSPIISGGALLQFETTRGKLNTGCPSSGTLPKSESRSLLDVLSAVRSPIVGGLEK